MHLCSIPPTSLRSRDHRVTLPCWASSWALRQAEQRVQPSQPCKGDCCHTAAILAVLVLTLLLEGGPTEGMGIGILPCPALSFTGLCAKAKARDKTSSLVFSFTCRHKMPTSALGACSHPSNGAVRRDVFVTLFFSALPYKQEGTAAQLLQGPALTVSGKSSRPVSSRDTCQ